MEVASNQDETVTLFMVTRKKRSLNLFFIIYETYDLDVIANTL